MASTGRLFFSLIVVAVLGVWLPGAHAATARKLQATLVIGSDPQSYEEFKAVATRLTQDQQITILTQLDRQTEADTATCNSNTETTMQAKSACETQVKTVNAAKAGEQAANSALRSDIAEVKDEVSRCDTVLKTYQADGQQCTVDLEQCLNDKDGCHVSKHDESEQCTKDVAKTNKDARDACDRDLAEMAAKDQEDLATKVQANEDKCTADKATLKSEVEERVRTAEETICTNDKADLTTTLGTQCDGDKAKIDSDCTTDLGKKDEARSAMEADLHAQISTQVAAKEACQPDLASTKLDTQNTQSESDIVLKQRDEQIKQLTEKINQKHAEARGLWRQRRQLKARNAELNAAITTLTDQIDVEKTAHKTGVEACTTAAEAEAEAKQDIINQKVKIINSGKEAIEQLTLHAAINQDEIVRLTSEKTAAEQAKADCLKAAGEEKAHQDSSIEALTERVRVATGEDGECEPELAKCNDEVAAAQISIGHLNEVIPHLTSERDTLVEYQNSLPTSNSELETSLAGIKKDVTDLTDAQSVLTQQIADEGAAAGEVKDATKEVDDQAQTLAEQAAGVQEEIHTVGETIVQVQTDVVTVEGDAQKQQNSNVELDNGVSSVEADAVAAAAGVLQLEDQVQAAHAQLQQQANAANALSTDRSALRNSLKALKKIVDKYNARHGPIDNLRRELDRFDDDFTKYTPVVYDVKGIQAALTGQA